MPNNHLDLYNTMNVPWWNRLASRHSKAATEAYLRSDHAAAQEFSQKAREEWSNAEKLNAKAAKEILAIRNCENDDWKLDLHGLHAAEAVQVLLEHLLKIESQVSGTHSSKPDKTKGSVNQETYKSDKQHQLLRPRLLEVITGNEHANSPSYLLGKEGSYTMLLFNNWNELGLRKYYNVFTNNVMHILEVSLWACWVRVQFGLDWVESTHFIFRFFYYE